MHIKLVVENNMKLLKKLFIGVVTTLSIIGIASCSKDNEKKDHYDDITKQLSLSKDYNNKDFIKDGVGTATLTSVADGDTATFNLSSGKSVTIRFYCVDTPESTGKVQKWGKTASLFTKGVLTNASEFVLESPTTPATTDSYGVRYLGYVWYRNSSSEAFKMLNLELVENGYSNSTAETINPYYSYFNDAASFAKKLGLRTFGTDEDVNYSDLPETTTLEAIVKDIADKENSVYYNYEINDGMGAYVRFDAYVKSHTTHGTPGSVTNYYSVGAIGEDGKEYTFVLYGGYGSDPINEYIKVGYKYSFVGYIQLYNSSFQVAIGGSYVALQSGDKFINKLQSDYLVSFDSSAERYTKSSETAMKSDLTVTDVKLESGVMTITGTAKNAPTAEAITYTIIVSNVGSNVNISDYSGKTLSFTGIQEEAGSNKITVASISSIKIK